MRHEGQAIGLPFDPCYTCLIRQRAAQGKKIMEPLTLSPELTQALTAEAQQRGKSLAALAEEWLRQHYQAVRRERLAVQTQRFWAKQRELYAQHPDQYVAFYQDEVLDHDHDLRELALRVRELHGQLPIVIAQVTETPVKSYQMRSPR
jgi:hypothetical protein